MKGIVKCYRPSFQYGFVDSNGCELFFHYNQTRLPAGHFCRLVQSEVEFDLDVDEFRRPRAINLQMIEPPTFPDIEISQVVLWNDTKHCGSAKRDCNCQIFFSEKQIVSEGIESLQPGSMIQHKHAIDYKGRTLAVEVEIFQQ